MHIWTIDNWKKSYDLNAPNHRTGLRIICDKDINPEVRRACKEFAAWLRTEFFFPKRVRVYLKNALKIKAMDGEFVWGTFWGPYDKNEEPYIRVAVGDYEKRLLKENKDNALAGYLYTIAHELTHYFQWLNNLELTPIGRERQATVYSDYILEEYKDVKDHP